MKKTSLTALLLAFCLIITGNIGTAGAADTTDGNAGAAVDSVTAERAKTLEALGILPESADSFAQKTEITRAEFAYIAARAAGCSDMSGGDDSAYFLDVADDSKYKNAIGSAVKLGLMRGTDEYTFEPDRAVAYTEAIKVTLCILGYEWMAEASGGYPSGYIKTAAQVGLSRGVQNADGMDGAAVVKLLYNALDTEMLIPTGFGKDISYESYEGRTLLTEKLKLEKVKGIVTAIPKTELYGEASLNDDEIMIEETRVSYENYSENLLGMSVTAYCDADSKDEPRSAVYIEVSDKNKLLEIDGGNASYSDGVFTYYDENDSQKRASAAAGAAVIFNGKALDDPDFDMKKTAPDEGRVTLIDNNDDGKYEVIKVRSHYNIRVQSTDTRNNIIYDKDGGSIKTSDITKWYFYDKDGKKSALKSIREDAVLAVEKSGDTVTFLEGKGTIGGTVDRVSAKKITVDGVEYKLSKSLKDSEKPSVGESGTFYLDVYGKIAFFDKNRQGTLTGVILGAKLTEGMETSVKIRLFNIMSEIGMYEVADKITLDGESVKLTDKTENGENRIMKRLADGAANEYAELTKSVKYGQVIRYKLNSQNEIKEIDTTVKTAKEDNNSLQIVTNAQSSFFKRDGMNFGGHTLIDGDTIVFQISLPMQNPEDDVKLTSSSAFSDNITETVEGLSFTDEKIISDVIMVYKMYGSGEISANNLEMLVDECGSALSGEDVLSTVSGYYNGSYVTYPIKDSASIDSELNTGDLIRFDSNAKSEIIKITHVYRAADNSFAYSGTSSNAGGWDVGFRVSQGYIYHTYEDAIVFAPAESIADVTDDSKRERFNMKGVKIYVYDKNNTRTPVYVGSKADLRSYLKNKEKAPKVYIRSKFSNVETILVVK